MGQMGAVKFRMRASALYFVTLLCCALGAAVGWDEHFAYYGVGEECRVEDNYSSPFVTALYERVSIAAGCASQERTADGREVHVINVRNGDALPAQSEITLQLIPRDDIGTFSERLVIILNSQQRVVWKLEADDRMSNASRHLFWISQDSRMKKKKDMRIKINKFKMPSQTDELVSWVRTRNVGAMTSFTEVKQANTIRKYVGIDPDSPEQCEVSSTLYHPKGVAMYLQSQVTRGCAALTNENYNNRDVHVIEVEQSEDLPQGSSPRVTDVLVDIKSRAKRFKQKNLFLVLKSHSDVRWKINTNQLRGSIHIITCAEDTVDRTKVYMQSVSTAVERLGGLSGQDLVDWTRDRYSPVLSYTGARLANRFHLTVDGADEARLSIVYPDDENETGDKTPSRSPFETPEKTKVAVLKAKNVNCFTQSIQVALRKATLKPYGVRRQHLTLNDETCVATENTTHFILETRLDECKTKRSTYDSQVVYENAVFVRKVPDLNNLDLDLEDVSGSGHDDIPDDLFIDDEDLAGSGDVIRVDFRCFYETGIPPEFPVSQIDGAVDYSLHLWESSGVGESYVADFPHVVADLSLLDIEASIHAEHYLKVVVESCWVSDSQRLHFSHTLINQECVIDNSVEWLTSGSSQHQRFRFVFRNFFDYSDHDVHVYVICQLTACATHRNLNIKQCSERRPLCLPRPYNVTFSRYTSNVEVGPLVMSRPQRGPPYQGPGVIDNREPEPADQSKVKDTACTTIVRVQGLDSATVVGIAFAAFVIGVVLMSSLWLIHKKTSRKGRHRARFAETSGESTPSSTAPITIHQVNHH